MKRPSSTLRLKVVRPVEDERRHVDGRQHSANVDLGVHPQERRRSRRTRAAAKVCQQTPFERGSSAALGASTSMSMSRRPSPARRARSSRSTVLHCAAPTDSRDYAMPFREDAEQQRAPRRAQGRSPRRAHSSFRPRKSRRPRRARTRRHPSPRGHRPSAPRASEVAVRRRGSDSPVPRLSNRISREKRRQAPKNRS